MKNFLKLYEAGSVKRWHTQLTLKEQDLAAHQWGVAMICMHIAPGNYELLQAALTHDLHESESGDIPYPAKKRYPLIGQAVDAQEEDFMHEYGLATVGLKENKHMLKWADMFELLLWCMREYSMGNRYVFKTINVARSALEAMGHPNEAARKLYEEVHGF